jgi:hypothetical protein
LDFSGSATVLREKVARRFDQFQDRNLTNHGWGYGTMQNKKVVSLNGKEVLHPRGLTSSNHS